MSWISFLRKMADDFDLSPEQTEVFLIRFDEENKQKAEKDIEKLFLENLDLDKPAYEKRRKGIYGKFTWGKQKPKGCRELINAGPHKAAKLRAWLEIKYAEEIKESDSHSATPTAVDVAEIDWRRELIKDKTKDFVGREYVFEAIADFIANYPKGYFIIEGDPGMGKSTIIAEYVRRTGCVVHFNVQGRYETVEEFLKTLCTELLNRYQLTSKTLPADSKQYGAFIDHLLAETANKRNGKQVVIALDALDEVDLFTHKSNDNILYLPRYLSEGIYFVMTRRRGVEIPFITDAPQQLFKLMDYENQSREDVRTYIQNRVNGSELLRQRIVERGETEAEFIEKIAEKSENNFMYLVNVLKDIEQGFYKDLSLERFPQGLQQYYEFHWRRMEMTVKPLPVTKINIVYHLAESHQPISCQLISEYVGEQQLTVQELLDDWEQFLHKPIIEGETCYSIYHASFRDFLHRKDIVQAAGVSLKAINKQKSDNLWEAMFGDE